MSKYYICCTFFKKVMKRKKISKIYMVDFQDTFGTSFQLFLSFFILFYHLTLLPVSCAFTGFPLFTLYYTFLYIQI